MSKNKNISSASGSVSGIQYGGTLTTNSGAISINNTTTSTAHTNSVFGNGTWVSGSWTPNPLDFLEDKSINLEKLDEMTPERRASVLSIISSLATSTENNVRKLLLNTLESYNLLESKDVITRKAKIESVVK